MNWTDWVGIGSDRTGGWGYLTTYLLYYQRLVDRVDRVETQASAYMYPGYLRRSEKLR